MGADHFVNKQIEYSYSPETDITTIDLTCRLRIKGDTLERDCPTPRLLVEEYVF